MQPLWPPACSRAGSGELNDAALRPCAPAGARQRCEATPGGVGGAASDQTSIWLAIPGACRHDCGPAAPTRLSAYVLAAAITDDDVISGRGKHLSQWRTRCRRGYDLRLQGLLPGAATPGVWLETWRLLPRARLGGQRFWPALASCCPASAATLLRMLGGWSATCASRSRHRRWRRWWQMRCWRRCSCSSWVSGDLPCSLRPQLRLTALRAAAALDRDDGTVDVKDLRSGLRYGPLRKCWCCVRCPLRLAC